MVWGVGCRFVGCRVQGVGCGVKGEGCRVQGVGCRGAGCRVVGVVRPRPLSISPDFAGLRAGLQGYLAHKKLPLPLGPP